MFEIGMSPIATPIVPAVMKALINVLALKAEGHQKHGVAPKSSLELRMEQALKGMGVWRDTGKD